jgi:hypothetical protein
LPLAASGLRLLDYTDVETRLPMTFDAYLRYALSGLNVASRDVDSVEEARAWCRETLGEVFAEGDVTVVIPGYLATVGPVDEE